MVFRWGTSRPKSLHWRDIAQILIKLCAIHVGDHGDHKKYKRQGENGKWYVITLPTYSDISGGLLDSIIRQTGVSKKIFWNVYFENPSKNETVIETK